MEPISVVICCANVASTLEAACQSVAWAEERVIVDSGSTDRTPAIARSFTDRYVVEPWRGYTEQKKFGCSLASHDWVLVLDGDEELTPELAAEIQSLRQGPMDHLDVLAMRRLTWVMGRPVRGYLPDWQRRLIHRQRARWTDHLLHDDRLPSHPSRQQNLKSLLWHRRTATPTFRDYFSGSQQDQRLVLQAMQAFKQGRRCRARDLWLRPPIAFFKSLILKGGFRDGTFGLLMAMQMHWATQLKYAALWAHQHDLLQPPSPGPSAAEAAARSTEALAANRPPD